MVVIVRLVWLIIETIIFSLVAQTIGYLCFRERIPKHRAGLAVLCAYVVCLLISGISFRRGYAIDPVNILLYIVPAVITFAYLYHRYNAAWLDESPADHFE